MLQYPPARSRSQCRNTVCKTFLYSLSYSLVSLLYQEITNPHLHGDSDNPHSQKLVFWQPKFSLFIISFHYLLKSIMMYYSLCLIIPYLNSKKGDFAVQYSSDPAALLAQQVCNGSTEIQPGQRFPNFSVMYQSIFKMDNGLLERQCGSESGCGPQPLGHLSWP